MVRVESPRGRMEAKARISGIKEGTVFVPFHYGYFDAPEGASPNAHARAANELTITDWDPASKQPLYKVGAVSVRKIAAGSGPAPAPTTTASAPAGEGVAPTTGDDSALVAEAVGDRA